MGEEAERGGIDDAQAAETLSGKHVLLKLPPPACALRIVFPRSERKRLGDEQIVAGELLAAEAEPPAGDAEDRLLRRLCSRVADLDLARTVEARQAVLGVAAPHVDTNRRASSGSATAEDVAPREA